MIVVLKKNDNEQEIKGLDNNILQSVDKEIKNENNIIENNNKEKKINQKKMVTNKQIYKTMKLF